MDLDDLGAAVNSGSVDTVVLALTDMQGRLQGKRLHGRHFIDEVVHAGSEGCDQLLATDVNMNPVDGYRCRPGTRATATSSWGRTPARCA
jgi:glutamine synthetase